MLLLPLLVLLLQKQLYVANTDNIGINGMQSLPVLEAPDTV
jgi:hypothetical protein